MSPGSGEHTSSNRRPAIVTFCPELEAPVAGSRHLIERAIALAGRAEVLLVGRSLRRTGRGNDAPRVSRVRAAGSEIELLRLASAPRLAPRSLVEAMALRTLLRDLRRENRLDLLDVIGSGPGCAEALWIAHRLGVPVSVTVAGAADPTAAPKGRVLRRADRVICANESAAGALRAIGVREPAIVREAVAARYRPLVRADCRDQLGLVRERPLVLCVADLEPGAGQDELFRAVAAMPVPGPQRPIVALVGDGSARSSLGNLAADLDLSDHVCFEGDPHLDGLPLYYGAANLVVKEPGREGGDRSEREALACGRKVVATNLDSLRDALEELLVEPSPGPSGVAPIDRDWNDVAQELLDLWRVLLPRRPIGGGRFESGQAEGDRARSLLRMGFRAQHSSSFRDQGAGAAGGLAAFQGLTDAEIGTKTDAERSEDYAQQVPGAGPTTCVGSAPDHRINKTPHPPLFRRLDPHHRPHDRLPPSNAGEWSGRGAYSWRGRCAAPARCRGESDRAAGRTRIWYR
ncbi:MAG: hypothetical protein CME06_01945 [Gemmatimonadetes bacterium]|nr:hypothetical protein [Gemmatimonadota bacterium]